MQINVQNISFKTITQTFLMSILLLFLGVSILDVDISFMLRGVSRFWLSTSTSSYSVLLYSMTRTWVQSFSQFFFAVLFNASRNFAVKSLNLLLCLRCQATFLSPPNTQCTYVNLDRTERILGPSEHSEAGTSAFLVEGRLDWCQRSIQRNYIIELRAEEIR